MAKDYELEAISIPRKKRKSKEGDGLWKLVAENRRIGKVNLLVEKVYDRKWMWVVTHTRVGGEHNPWGYGTETTKAGARKAAEKCYNRRKGELLH